MVYVSQARAATVEEWKHWSYQKNISILPHNFMENLRVDQEDPRPNILDLFKHAQTRNMGSQKITFLRNYFRKGYNKQMTSNLKGKVKNDK